MVVEWITAVLLAIGSLLSLISAVGLLRMPDLFTRMQAATKAATLGVSCLLLALAVHFGDMGVATRAVLVIAFMALTIPVSAHMICQAAYIIGVPLWERSVIDELREHGIHGPPRE